MSDFMSEQLQLRLWTTGGQRSTGRIKDERRIWQSAVAMVTNLHMLDFLDTVVLGDEGGVW